MAQQFPRVFPCGEPGLVFGLIKMFLIFVAFYSLRKRTFSCQSFHQRVCVNFFLFAFVRKFFKVCKIHKVKIS